MIMCVIINITSEVFVKSRETIEFISNEVWAIDDEFRFTVNFYLYWGRNLVTKEVTVIDVTIESIETVIGNIDVRSMNNRLYLELMDKLKTKSEQLVDKYMLEEEEREFNKKLHGG